MALTFMLPKFTIPLSILSSSSKSSDVSSRASDRSFILIFERRVPVRLFTKEVERISSAVTGENACSIIFSGNAMKRATLK